MEEMELNVDNDENSSTDLESNTQGNNVEETTSLTADKEMSNNDSTLEESQDENIDSQQNESAPPTD
jgi:hypothetical protein